MQYAELTINLYTKFGGQVLDTPHASLQDFQQALNKLYLSRNIEHDSVSIENDSELTLEIYLNSIVLQDYISHKYDGPGGPGEKFRARINVNTIFDNAARIVDLLKNGEEEELISFLKTLPKVK